MMTSRHVGVAMAAAGMALSAAMAWSHWAVLTRPWVPEPVSAVHRLASATAQVSTTGSIALTVAGLLVLLFSRAVPRWWSLAYLGVALALLVATIVGDGQVAAALVERLRQEPDLPRSGWTPDTSAWVILAPRLILGIVASLAIAAPWLLPPQLAQRRPDVPAQPLGL